MLDTAYELLQDAESRASSEPAGPGPRLCHLAQRPSGARHTVAVVQLRPTKSAVAAAWILAAGVIGVMANVRSVGAAILVVGLGLVPPLVMLFRWRDPPQTLSESIQEARR